MKLYLLYGILLLENSLSRYYVLRTGICTIISRSYQDYKISVFKLWKEYKMDELKSLSVKELILDKNLRGKVINLMREHQSYNFILQYLASKGYKMARGSLTNFKNKVQEAQDTGVDLEDLADGRKKKSVEQVDKDKIKGYDGNMHLMTSKQNIKDATGSYDFYNEIAPKQKLTSNAQVLESVIEKGFDTLQNMDTVDTATTLKAVEMMQKYFAQDSRGLSQEALKQYQLIMQARMSAASEVMMQYVPSDKQEEALNAMDEKEHQFLKDYGANEDTKELMEELKKDGLM